MTCAELSLLLPLRHLDDDVLDADERAALDAHIESCATCPDLLEDVEAALSLPNLRAPEGVWNEIEVELGAASTQQPNADLRVILSCTYCHAELRKPESVYCAECLAPHHRDCFEDHGRCSATGCSGVRLVSPQDVPRRATRRPWKVAGIVLAGLGVAALTIWTWTEEPVQVRDVPQIAEVPIPEFAVPEVPVPDVPVPEREVIVLEEEVPDEAPSMTAVAIGFDREEAARTFEELFNIQVESRQAVLRFCWELERGEHQHEGPLFHKVSLEGALVLQRAVRKKIEVPALELERLVLLLDLEGVDDASDAQIPLLRELWTELKPAREAVTIASRELEKVGTTEPGTSVDLVYQLPVHQGRAIDALFRVREVLAPEGTTLPFRGGAVWNPPGSRVDISHLKVGQRYHYRLSVPDMPEMVWEIVRIRPGRVDYKIHSSQDAKIVATVSMMTWMVPRVDDPPEAGFRNSKTETITLAGREWECWVTEDDWGGRRWSSKNSFPTMLKMTDRKGMVTSVLVRIEEPAPPKRRF